MTCREKLKAEHPEYVVGNGTADDCCGCPHNYGYLPVPVGCGVHVSCTECWNREIPEKTTNAQFAEAVINGQHVKPGILDSGDRTQFETGAVRDIREGKGRMDLLPWSAIMEVSKHCENGAKKYGEHNVDKGIPTSSLCDSAARHLAKYLEGWTDEPHLVAAAWNLLWAIQMEIKNPDVVNTPYRGQTCSERKYDK